MNAAKMQILQDNRSQLDQTKNSVRFQAAIAELDLAITFYIVAAATKNRDRSDRAIISAQRAYAIAASSLDCNLKAGQNHELEEKFILLNAARAICRPPTLSSFPVSGVHGVGEASRQTKTGRRREELSPFLTHISCIEASKLLILRP